MGTRMRDIHPRSPIAALDRDEVGGKSTNYQVMDVSAAVGMSPTFIRKAVGQKKRLLPSDVLALLDQDAFSETFVPRSGVFNFLEALQSGQPVETQADPNPTAYELRRGQSLDLASRVPRRSVQSVVTSPPYWATRIYDDSRSVQWADGEFCPYGHEQTPEGYARHTAELLWSLSRLLRDDGSIWWIIMDTYNTRAPIRRSSAEAMRAMRGRDGRKWADHPARRYSAGHAYLKDGDQCLIPGMIAQRAARIGLYVKSLITWAKVSTLPDPQDSRVSRNLEYVLHLSKQRAPKFRPDAYLATPRSLGGRDSRHESARLSDVWVLNTASGEGAHGAQFPIALPGRCVSLTTDPGDLVLDPFVGSGTTGAAAIQHGCAFLGWDTSAKYLAEAETKLRGAAETGVPRRRHDDQQRLPLTVVGRPTDAHARGSASTSQA